MARRFVSTSSPGQPPAHRGERAPERGAAGRCADPAPLGPSFAELRPRLTAVALRFAPSRDAAEDIVQNAFEKAIRNLDQFAGRARLSTWLHRIVVNESLMWLRAERRRRKRFSEPTRASETPIDAGDSSPDALQRLSEHEREHLLKQGLAALPAQEREVLQACALGDCSYEEYSRRAGIRTAAAKSRAFRGRQRLRSLLSEI